MAVDLLLGRLGGTHQTGLRVAISSTLHEGPTVRRVGEPIGQS